MYNYGVELITFTFFVCSNMFHIKNMTFGVKVKLQFIIFIKFCVIQSFNII